MAGALAQLREGGIPVDQIPEDVQRALDDLSSDEVSTMIKVREKLQAATGDEVEGFRMAADNNSNSGVFYH